MNSQINVLGMIYSLFLIILKNPLYLKICLFFYFKNLPNLTNLTSLDTKKKQSIRNYSK